MFYTREIFARAPALLLALMFLGNVSQGQMTVSIDVDPAPGIQNSIQANPGDMIQAAVVVDVGASGMSAYGISVQFDTTELDLKGATPATELLPAGLSFNVDPGVESAAEDIGGGLGQVTTFEAATFGSGVFNSSFTVGTIDFTAVAPANGLSDVDIIPGFFGTGLDGAFDDLGLPISPTFVGAAVQIPEPTSVTLLSTALLGLLAIRRGRL